MTTLNEIRNGNHSKLKYLFKNATIAYLFDYVKMSVNRETKYNGFLELPEDISLERIYQLILYTRNNISDEDKQHCERAIGKFQGLYQFVNDSPKLIYIPDITIYIGKDVGKEEDFTEDSPIEYISLLYHPISQNRNLYI